MPSKARRRQGAPQEKFASEWVSTETEPCAQGQHQSNRALTNEHGRAYLEWMICTSGPTSSASATVPSSPLSDEVSDPADSGVIGGLPGVDVAFAGRPGNSLTVKSETLCRDSDGRRVVLLLLLLLPPNTFCT